MMSYKYKKNKGFTLVELIVVLLILAILLALALGQAGFNAGQAGVNTWSFQGKGSSYYFYWTTEDISSKSPGDKVKVI